MTKVISFQQRLALWRASKEVYPIGNKTHKPKRSKSKVYPGWYNRNLSPMKIRRELAMIYGWLCWYCGINIGIDHSHMDHIIPVAKGGITDVDNNIALSCPDCNMLKQTKSIERFVVDLDQRQDRTVTGILGKPYILLPEVHRRLAPHL